MPPPSPPLPPGNSSNKVATVLAVAHDNIEPHLNLHACSVRCEMGFATSFHFGQLGHEIPGLRPGLPLPGQSPPDRLVNGLPQALGTCVPSSFASSRDTPSTSTTPLSRIHLPEYTHKRRPTLHTLTMMLIVTRPPASRQILASMLPKTNSRNTVWILGSRQPLTGTYAKSEGEAKHRTNKTQGLSDVGGLVGQHVRNSPAPGSALRPQLWPIRLLTFLLHWSKSNWPKLRLAELEKINWLKKIGRAKFFAPHLMGPHPSGPK